MQPILTVVCNEPEGDVERKVYPFTLTPDNATKFWDRASKYPSIFGRTTPPGIQEFLDMFFYKDHTGLFRTDNLIWIVDDFVGILTLTNIQHPYDAYMHFSFFDGRLKGRAVLLRECIKYLINEYGFNRLSAEIPCYVKDAKGSALFKFVTNGIDSRDKKGNIILDEHGNKVKLIDGIGLFMEGRKRKAAEYKGQLFDVMMYGITKEAIDQWEAQKPKQLVAAQPSQ